MAPWRPRALCLLLLAACARTEMNLLEEEMARYKAENERIRAEDLEARTRAQKERSDKLSVELLELGRTRDRMYTESDRTRVQLAELRRQQASGQQERSKLESELVRQKEELEALRRQCDLLRSQIREAEALRRALEERKSGGSAPD